MRWRRLAGSIAGVIAASALVAGQASGRKAPAAPKVTATSVFVLNADTGQPLYVKGENKRFRILSLTKLITAHVLVERLGGRLSDTVTITKAHLARGSTAGLRKGDVWTLRDLLHGMLLVSGNDAALAIADHVGRTILAREKKRGDPRKRFVREMGSAAAALGARNARFADPYGISPANAATGRDVGLIAAKIFTDPRLLPAWQCPERTLNIGGPDGRSVTIKTTLEILGEDNVVGAKTGTHVGKNIYNLVTAWRAPNGQTIVAVVLGAADHSSRYADVRTILEAVPHDFSELAEPVAGAAQRSGKVSCP
ncbi:MAG: serine hydrolase [Hyphomicrobiales bacterium]|nr:serine hydrolase [Hyphomicrobiales bacterium]